MDMDVISCLYDSSNAANNDSNISMKTEGATPDDITSMLMSSFNEAEGDEETTIDWGVSDSEEETETDTESGNSESEDVESTETEEEVSEDDIEEDDASENEETEDEDVSDASSDDEFLGTYEAIKDEIDGERETLSDIYERFFKDLVEPLFRRLEDSNINVAFDTTALKTNGLIRIELSHRSTDASAEMEINIFANTVNGEFLGMENSEGEAITTSLDDVSLDDLISILIKVLA